MPGLEGIYKIFTKLFAGYASIITGRNKFRIAWYFAVS